MIFTDKYKAGALCIMALLFCLMQTSSVAQAQVVSNINRDVINRLKQVERQIQDISRSVFRDGKKAIASMGSGDSSATVAGFEERVSQIEQDQRNITNKLERMEFELRKMQDKLKLIQSDNDQRFNQAPQSINRSKKSELDVPVTNVEPRGTSKTLGTLSNKRGEAESIYEKAFKNIKDVHYDKAEEGFTEFLEKYPNHPLAPNSQYWLGETFYVRADYKQAAKSFAKGYQKFPKSAKAQDSLLKLSLSLAALGKKKDACLTLEQLKKEGETNPNHPIQRRVVKEMKKINCR